MFRKSVLLAIFAAGCGNGDTGLVPGVEVIELSAPARLELPCGALEDDTSDGVTDLRWTYSYQSGGRYEIDKNFLPDGTLNETDEYETDGAGRLLHVSFGGPGSYGEGVFGFFYDSFGRILEEAITSTYPDSGTQVQRTIYSAWNDAGRPTASHTTLTGVQPYSTAFAYDEDGRVVSRTDTYEDGTERARKTVTYDDSAGTRTIHRHTTDSNYDSTWVETYRDGRFVSRVITNNVNGTSETYHVFYDGNRYLRDENTRSDGTKMILRYLYSCPSS
jgi:YD repeat-containing protein